ncbi:MAG: TonB-dependent receptor [Ignavibacteria bacterium]|nr:TonB-dependent receptor [Ignavibacteria bacterium]
MENKLANTTSSSSLLLANDIQQIPTNKFSDVFNAVPGFLIFKKDGMGRDAIVSTRGFYGGGEAEYILVFKNGVRINDLETGLVDWNTISPDEINKIEIVRGPTSALYGDIAASGIVNIVTNIHSDATSNANVSIGSFGNKNFGIQTNGALQNNPFHLYFRNAQSGGFRKHNEYTGTSSGAELNTPLSENSKLIWSFSHRSIDYDDAGPLTQEEMDNDRESANAYFLSDGRNEKRLNGSVTYSNEISSAVDVKTHIYFQNRTADIVRTIPFTYSMPFVDTKQRNVTSSVFGGDVSAMFEQEIGTIQNKLIAGGEIERGELQSRYFDFKRETNTKGVQRTKGKGNRTHFGIYAHDELSFSSSLKMNVGFRFDNFSDKYEVLSQSTTNSAYSPKIGLNYLYANVTENGVHAYSGNVYINASRAFKVPTLDQLFDERPYPNPNPFGPSSVTISNLNLKPQYGWNYEIGLYQRGKIVDNVLYGELHTSAYQQQMKDEIDYDAAKFKYDNISQTKHFGIENGLKLHWLPNVVTFANYTYTSVTFDGGTNSGKQLRSIPKHTASAGITYKHLSNIAGTLTWNYFGKRYIDDGNTISLASSNEINVRLSYTQKIYRLYIDVDNMFNATYSDLAFQLPADQTTVFYPHAPREIRVGIETTFDTPWFSF